VSALTLLHKQNEGTTIPLLGQSGIIARAYKGGYLCEDSGGSYFGDSRRRKYTTVNKQDRSSESTNEGIYSLLLKTQQ
jgi:hypothetical protein